jgi:4-carboxymuconolactone decarboxylase
LSIPADENFETYSTENVKRWKQRGEDLCRRIYGSNFERLLQNVGELSPSLREWMLHEGYGRILARPALPIDVREMGIIAILTVKDYPRQLHSHLRGALRVGLTIEELREGIQLCAEYTEKSKIESALQILAKLS